MNSLKGEASKHSHIRLLLLCLGILCILLVVTVIVVVVYFFLVTEEKDKQAANLTAENKQLIRDLVNMTEELIRNKNTTDELMRDLKNTTEELNRNKNMTKELMRDRDDLNYTLRAILKYDSFPVSAFCSGLTFTLSHLCSFPVVSDCNPCQSGWLLFQGKCYLFYNQKDPWKTWQQSREMCQNNSSDLVIIDSPGEQEFISNHTEYYFDQHHGYWIGLKESNNTWFWVNGRNVTLEYWAAGEEAGDQCVQLIHDKPLKENWKKNKCSMKNRFVCETEALIRL
ncbi:asialoglycoprotein receptor 1-like [Mugil cephalus]|uniref:asialoglycoprotein receptor 1-like n=1 Tax=Mugil cephalus TaxID=48193 RepID=UPI001FB5DA54|nr:asialoglycoprotein receptor 1-like [Mugil cephalus]